MPENKEIVKFPAGDLMVEAFEKYAATDSARDLFSCIKLCKPDDPKFALNILRLAFFEGFHHGSETAFRISGNTVRQLAQYTETDGAIAKNAAATACRSTPLHRLPNPVEDPKHG